MKIFHQNIAYLVQKVGGQVGAASLDVSHLKALTLMAISYLRHFCRRPSHEDVGDARDR